MKHNEFLEFEFLDRVEQALHELETSDGLRVILVPSREADNRGKLRAAESQNPDWYRKFAGQYTNCRGLGRKRMRRPRTNISRVRTITALRRILAGDRSGIYAERLTEFFERELTNERHRRQAQAAEPDTGEPLPF